MSLDNNTVIMKIVDIYWILMNTTSIYFYDLDTWTISIIHIADEDQYQVHPFLSILTKTMGIYEYTSLNDNLNEIVLSIRVPMISLLQRLIIEWFDPFISNN